MIDSGVSDQTGDLNFAPAEWSKSWISGQSPFTDANGHGTHIAGTIGALVNGRGIVGVAPGAQIISLKVNNDAGFGDGSTTAKAVDYAIDVINKNNLDKSKVVINLSINATFDPLLNSSVINGANQGIKFAISAGNNGKDVDGFSPVSTGYHPNVFTVSAVDSSNRMPFWSNWDRIDSNDSVDDVDFSAPGVGILSYYKNNQLSELSGTSMATAHISGLLITGGVQAGNYVTPNYSDTSDPFAITSTQVFNPSAIITSGPYPTPAPPVSTFKLSAPSSVKEGETLKVDIATTNLRVGSDMYWQISGNGIEMNDFYSINNLWGNAIVADNGTSSINFNIKKDGITEGNEVIKFELFDSSHPSTRKKVTESLITIEDTSKTPPPIQYQWGTTGNDVINGGEFRDTITGSLSSGTSLSAMGSGQIDVLIGGSDTDVFVLGDSRGIFYNDGVSNSLGRFDYALIKDFKVGEDKIQVKSGLGGYLSEVVNGNLSLYWDVNRTGRIETSGFRSDELIAVFEGVTALSNSEYIAVR